MAQLFVEAGLTNIDTCAIHVEAVYETFDALWEPLVTGNGSVVDYALALSSRHREALRERTRQRVENTADGTIRLTVGALAVRGVAVGD